MLEGSIPVRSLLANRFDRRRIAQGFDLGGQITALVGQYPFEHLNPLFKRAQFLRLLLARLPAGTKAQLRHLALVPGPDRQSAHADAGQLLQAPAPAQRQAPRQASTPGTSPAVRRIKEEIARKKGHQP